MNLSRALLGALLCATLAGTAGAARAFTVAGLELQKVDPRARTRVLVIGFSDGNKANFVHAAIARARKYREAYPADQVVLIGASEYEETGEGSVALADVTPRGLTRLASIDRILDAPELMRQLRALTQIASLDFYGHSKLYNGPGLENPVEGKVHSMDPRMPGIEALAENFTEDAYVMLNGCNSGFFGAPELSRTWRVPVMGNLSSSDFQTMREDGSWYFHNPGQYPAELEVATWNTKSFEVPELCTVGACMRLVPENKPYQSEKRGNFEAGLGFPKFFCNFENASARCERAMAQSLMSNVSVTPLVPGRATLEQFRAVVLDALCPVLSETRERASCIAALRDSEESGNRVFSSFRGNPIECDMRSCKFETYEKPDGKTGLRAPHNEAPSTQINEYLMYLKGWGLLGV